MVDTAGAVVTTGISAPSSEDALLRTLGLRDELGVDGRIVASGVAAPAVATSGKSIVVTVVVGGSSLLSKGWIGFEDDV